MILELDSKHGKITVDDKDIVMESEHYDIYEGLKAMRGGEPDKTVRCYAIHNEYGCVAVVFARNEQDAMDDAADAGKLDSVLIAEEDRCRIMYPGAGESEDTYEDETITYLGDASEPYLLDNIGLVEIPVPAFSLAGLFFASMVNEAHEHATVTYYRNFGGINIDKSLTECALK